MQLVVAQSLFFSSQNDMYAFAVQSLCFCSTISMLSHHDLITLAA